MIPRKVRCFHEKFFHAPPRGQDKNTAKAPEGALSERPQ
jgi:hypothetical protein